MSCVGTGKTAGPGSRSLFPHICTILMSNSRPTWVATSRLFFLRKSRGKNRNGKHFWWSCKKLKWHQFCLQRKCRRSWEIYSLPLRKYWERRILASLFKEKHLLNARLLLPWNLSICFSALLDRNGIILGLKAEHMLKSFWWTEAGFIENFSLSNHPIHLHRSHKTSAQVFPEVKTVSHRSSL